MVKMGRIWLLVLLVFSSLVLFSSTALAQSLVEVTPVTNEITGQEEAVFNLLLRNTGGDLRTYTISARFHIDGRNGQEAVWNITPEITSVDLSSGEHKIIKVSARPLGVYQPSAYPLKLIVESFRNGRSRPLEHFEETLNVVLFPSESIGYAPAVRLEANIPDSVDPQKPLPITLVLKNRNPRNLESLLVHIKSDMPEFEQEAIVDLSPFEQETVEFSVTPNPYQDPKEYLLFFVLEFEGETVKVADRTINIIALELPFSVAPAARSVFFKKRVSLEVHNPGNVENVQEVRHPVTAMQALFARSERPVAGSVVRAEGQRYLQWEVSLKPNETTNLSYAINYRSAIYVLLLLILLGAFYLAVRSPIRVLKKAQTVRGEEGTLSLIKIVLEVQNKTSKPVKSLHVVDMIPGIADVEKNIEMGTLKPHEFKHTTRGTKVIWSLPELEPHEHRVISYKIKAKLNILGSIILPRAVAEYSQRKKRRKAYSNTFQLGV